MTARMARRLAGVSLGVFGVSMILYVILGWLNGNIQRTPADDLPLSFAFAAFMIVGALIVARRPGNCVGQQTTGAAARLAGGGGARS